MDSFHLKYRPTTLDRIIGHDKAVTRLQGIISSGKIPNAILFTGPSSAGKTTLARAFTASLFEVEKVEGHRDFKELNAADSRGIDDIRELTQLAKLSPHSAPKRVILVDEVHQITGAAANALLKPLESPPPRTLFILGTMEPEKLLQAVKNRCNIFVLESQQPSGIKKYLKRILKGEKLDYIEDTVLERLVQNSNGEFRTAASSLEALVQYCAGKGNKKITEADVEDALDTTEAGDEDIAVRLLLCIYAKKFSKAHRAIMDVQDPFRFVNTLFRLNTFLLNSEVLGVDSHKSVWYSAQNKNLKQGVREVLGKDVKPVLHFAKVQEHLVWLKGATMSFSIPETALLSSFALKAIESL